MDLNGLRRELQRPIDIASLALFRVAFGAVGLYEMWRMLTSGDVDVDYIEPELHFPYEGFGWVEAWSGDLTYLHVYVTAALAICVMVGLFYRLAAFGFCLGYTYLFLIDQAQYQNHFYLICLVSALMVFVPAHRTLSIDARRTPDGRADWVPAWSLWLLRAQMGLVYFFGSLAKLNGDWLRGWPLRAWLPSNDFYLPPVSDLLSEAWVALMFSYAGLLLDLLAVPALLWRRSRPYMLGILLLFHFMNKQLFGIGVFPVLASAMTLLFLPPDWPRRLFNWPRSAAGAPAGSHLKRTTVPLLAVYLAVQILVPLRHFFYPGNVSWTEEGHRFAWHMKLRDKDCSSAFELTDPSTGETWEEDAYDYLSSHQSRKMPSRPYLALQFARYLRQVAAQNGHGAVQVRARIECSLNGRYQYALIDPDVDLARQTYGLASAAWILPLPDSEPGEIFR